MKDRFVDEDSTCLLVNGMALGLLLALHTGKRRAVRKAWMAARPIKSADDNNTALKGESPALLERSSW